MFDSNTERAVHTLPAQGNQNHQVPRGECEGLPGGATGRLHGPWKLHCLTVLLTARACLHLQVCHKVWLFQTSAAAADQADQGGAVRD